MGLFFDSGAVSMNSLIARELGANGASIVNRVESRVAFLRSRSLELQGTRASEWLPTHCQSGGGVSSLALDCGTYDRYLLGGKGNGEIILHDLALPACKCIIAHYDRKTAQRTAHKYDVGTISWFGGDNGLFVSGSSDTKAIVWDTSTFSPVSLFPFGSAVNSVAFSPVKGRETSKLLAVGTMEFAVRLCDLRSGARTHVLQGHRGAVLSCCWSPSSEWILATGSADRTVRLWDTRRSGKESCIAILDQHNSIRVGDGTESSQTMQTTVTNRSSMTNFQNYSHDGAVKHVKFSEDGRFLLSSGADKCLKLWSEAHQYSHGFQNTFTNFSAVAHGYTLNSSGIFATSERPAGYANKTAYCATTNNSICCFDMFEGGYVHPIESSLGTGLNESGHFMPITDMVFRESVQELFTSSRDGMILRWSSAYPGRRRPCIEHCTEDRNVFEKVENVSDWESEDDIT